jgi:hypothetical protein
MKMEEELSIKYSSGTETNRKPNRFNVLEKNTGNNYY